MYKQPSKNYFDLITQIKLFGLIKQFEFEKLEPGTVISICSKKVNRYKNLDYIRNKNKAFKYKYNHSYFYYIEYLNNYKIACKDAYDTYQFARIQNDMLDDMPGYRERKQEIRLNYSLINKKLNNYNTKAMIQINKGQSIKCLYYD